MPSLMERIPKSFETSHAAYLERLADGTQPRYGLEGLPTWLSFLDPDNTTAIVAANVGYLIICALLALLVTARGSGFKAEGMMKGLMLVYNAMCVLLAGYVAVGMVYVKATGDPGTFVCNKMDLVTEQGKWLTHFMWVFYAQKYWEFLDTWIFILKASWRQVSFLHVYHHMSITIMVAIFLRYDSNGDCCLAAVANGLIHVFMYSHYFASVLKINTWWRKHLTTMQLAQFTSIFTQACMMLAKGPGCGYPDWTKVLMVAYQSSMLVLFGNFFMQSYVKKDSKGKDKPTFPTLLMSKTGKEKPL